MSKRPLAWRHLKRIYELVTNGSICRVAEEKGLSEHPSVLRAATADRGIAEEALALATERGWSVPPTKSYAWALLTNFADTAPRILRIVQRDLFELDGIYRETDDDDVASLAALLQAERRTLAAELGTERPQLTLPGAK